MNSENRYDLETLHTLLVSLKKRHLKEKSIILEPIVDLDYETVVKIMDSVRLFKNTDDEIYMKDKDGIEVKVKELFANIVFGNIQS